MKIQRPFWMWPQRSPQIRDAAEGRVFVDAAAGRKHLKQQRVRNKLSAASRAEETETRHDEWRADMEALYRKHHWSGRRIAMRLAERYRTEWAVGDPKSVSSKRLENLWVKWRPRN